MIKANNGYDTLKSVIVGRELELPKRMADITFKVFYKENLGESIYDYYEDYTINSKILNERIEDLDNLAKTLENLGIKVYRPEVLNKVHKIKTPTFETELSSPSNVRDITFVYQNKIIETPVLIRNRYFENINMNKIFYDVWEPQKGEQWIKSPHQWLLEDTIDLEDWNNPKDFLHSDKFYEMAIDGAQFMRINEKECFVNISTHSAYKGFLWVKSLFPDVTFYPIFQLIDNHIDGAFVILDEGKFLVNPKFHRLKDMIPQKFRNWDFLISGNPDDNRVKKYQNYAMQLASTAGMDMNVLSINPKTVIVNKDAVETIKVLEKNKFDVVPIQFRHSELFGGGIHCSTLDLWREK